MRLEFNEEYNIKVMLYDKQQFAGILIELDEDGLTMCLNTVEGNVYIDYKDIKAILHEKKAQ